MPLLSDSRTKKVGEVMKADRRQLPRYVLSDDVFIMFKVNYNRLGKLKDLSSSGLAFQYSVLGEYEKLADGEVDIFTSEPDHLMLSRVPCRVIYDMKIEEPSFGGIETRRCGLKFKYLSQQQHELLHILLISCAWHSSCQANWRHLRQGF